MNKLMKVCVALAAFVALAALPSAAVAKNSATLTQPTGTVLAAGASIVGKGNHNAVTQLTGANTSNILTCTTNELKGTLVTNTHATISGNITSATFKGEKGVTPHTTHCSGASVATVTANPATNGLPWCLDISQEEVTDHFQVRGNECSKAARPIRFEFHATTIFGTVTCVMERAGAITGTYTTHPNAAVLTIDHVEFKRVGGVCTSEVGFLDMQMNLEREGAGAIYIDPAGT